MELHEYPRPANDTGIGVHWAPGFASAIGMNRIREQWLPEMRALGVKWVKIYNHDGALDFTELLLAEGFMPIIRIYRPTPNPGRVSLRDIVQVDSFLRVGARYFEFNSEPDRDSEWKGGRVPANGQDLVAEDTIVNLEAILERGGMPGIPAVSSGSNWDLVGRIIARGRKDIFQGPVWQALHNYARNRPLDYPYDIGSQEGAAFTERFYETVANEKWDENAWRGRSLADVNRLRMDRSTPGATLRDDHGGWLAFQYFDALNRHHLGRSLPLLATEGGYCVGEETDARYPATTPNLHMAQTLEACRMIMGTSTRYPAAPDYLFCVAFAVLANEQLGGTSAWWERYAWYSQRWPGGALPIVRALHAEPKVVRKWQGNGDAKLISLRGAVLHAHGEQTVVLERAGSQSSALSGALPGALSGTQPAIQVASAPLDANSRFLMTDLAPGEYVLRIANTAIEQPVTLAPDQQDVIVNLDMATALESVSRSIVSGHVDGGAGSAVVLLRHKDGEEFVTMIRDDGSYRFVDVAPGSYSLRLQPEGTRAESLILDGRNQVEVDLAAGGWGHVITTADPTPGIGAVRVQVRGFRRTPVQLHMVDGSTQPVLTGSDPALGEDVCEITGLENGLYIVTVGSVTDENAEPIEPEARVTVDRTSVPLVIFSYNEITAPRQSNASRIDGRVIGPLEELSPLRVRLVDARARTTEARVAGDGSFSFESLAPGAYAVEVVGHEHLARKQDIALNGANHVGVDLLLPMQMRQPALPRQLPGRSIIAGQAPGAAGRLARLVDAVGNERRQIVGMDDTVRFEELPAGEYILTVEGGFEQGDLLVDGRAGQSIEFAPLASAWEVQVTRAESMPGYSVVRVEIEGKSDVPVYIWKEGWEGMMKRSGSSASNPFSLEFAPLGPGTYMIEPDGLNVWTDVELTGLEAVWITFRPRTTPASPNRITRTAAVARAGEPRLAVDGGRVMVESASARPYVSASMGSASVESASVTSASVGSASVGSVSVGSAPVTSASEDTVPPTDYRQPPTDYRQPPTDYRTAPTDYRQPPTDYRQPPTDYRQPPTDYRHTDTPAHGHTDTPAAENTGHYIWVGDGASEFYDMSALIQYAAAENAVAGSEIAEAFKASFVTIVGDPIVTEPLRVRLVERGIEVINYEQVLAEKS